MSQFQPGPKHPYAQFTWQQVRAIRALWLQGEVLAREMARGYGCRVSTIKDIVENRRYVDPGYKLSLIHI